MQYGLWPVTQLPKGAQNLGPSGYVDNMGRVYTYNPVEGSDILAGNAAYEHIQ